jgi:hypothetical protein
VLASVAAASYFSYESDLMKAFLTLYLSAFCFTAFAHSPTETAEYSIIFGNCFANEQLSLKINNKLVFENYKMIANGSAKGNLSLTQNRKGLVVFYNSRQQKKTRIKANHLINLSIVVNNKTHQLPVDLRKGKVIVLDYCTPGHSNTLAGKISVEQIQETLVLL